MRFFNQGMRTLGIIPEEIVGIMNQWLALDHDAVEALVEHRVECNDALADSKSILVTAEDPPKVGLLGMINGLISLSHPTLVVAAIYERDSMRLEYFALMETKSADETGGERAGEDAEVVS